MKTLFSLGLSNKHSIYVVASSVQQALNYGEEYVKKYKINGEVVDITILAKEDVSTITFPQEFGHIVHLKVIPD